MNVSFRFIQGSLPIMKREQTHTHTNTGDSRVPPLVWMFSEVNKCTNEKNNKTLLHNIKRIMCIYIDRWMNASSLDKFVSHICTYRTCVCVFVCEYKVNECILTYKYYKSTAKERSPFDSFITLLWTHKCTKVNYVSHCVSCLYRVRTLKKSYKSKWCRHVCIHLVSLVIHNV